VSSKARLVSCSDHEQIVPACLDGMTAVPRILRKFWVSESREARVDPVFRSEGDRSSA